MTVYILRAGRVAMEHFGAYAVSKAAIEMYSDVLRLEMKKWNVCVCIIEPQGYRTGLCHLFLFKKCTNFETVQLKIIRIDFDDIWQKYSKYTRIEFVCFSFPVGLLF